MQQQPKARYFINSPKFVAGLSDLPDCSIRIPVKFNSKEVIKSKKKLPLILKSRVVYYIYDRQDYKFYKITAYRGEKFDGATIWLYSRITGHPLQGEYLAAAIIHDKYCRNPELLDNKRRLSSEIFYEFLLLCCVPKYKALLMREFVDLFQIIMCFVRKCKALIKRLTAKLFGSK